ncbi:serine hydrolase [Ruminococcus sp.]|uniref:D-alanyl-D-alanine carboxypeptidase family protein n=1 Tax=Ruminococcus sp. TaxID=41978 RepID=UPI002C8B9905|nr:serine hydrolase [Ruminococcus sp.]HNZ98305.1 serine hydrolase [Ruminococcus sp.]HOH85864.1 serine hydrolase [Ruminococcus sp.]
MNKRRKQRRNANLFKSGTAVFLLVLIFIGAFTARYLNRRSRRTASVAEIISDVAGEVTTGEVPVSAEATTEQSEEAAVPFVVFPEKTDKSQKFKKEYDAKNAILINVDDNEVVAYRDEHVQLYPASLTKIMTLVIAVENIKDLSATVPITYEMVAPYIALDASRAGFEPDETPTLKDVLYGMILCSGADASLAAAEYVSGSEEAFVKLMNEKCDEIGLKHTHFTNVAGLHDKNNYSTAEDIAILLEYAIGNDICREILSAVEYKVPPTEQNADGLVFESTLFSRMYGDEMPGVKVLGGKTGFTDEAGNCIATFAEVNGKKYILVLCGGTTNWNNVYNTLSAYSEYCAGGKAYEPSDKREK